jgi:hypothetical protein
MSRVAESPVHHFAEERLGEPGSYLTIERGDRVYDLYGWAAGRVAEPRIAPTRDEFFDGVVVAFRGRRLFVDAPEVRAVYDGAVLLQLTVADLTRAASDRSAKPTWPGGPCEAHASRPTEPAAPDDVVGLTAAVSQMYVAGRLSLASFERNVGRGLGARTRAELDAIAGELLPPAPA